MGVPTLEVGYTSATTGRRDHEVHKGYVVALAGGYFILTSQTVSYFTLDKNMIYTEVGSEHFLKLSGNTTSF
jgi:hypothetical protein